MPAICHVKFHGALVSESRGSHLKAVIHLDTGIQVSGTVSAVQVHNGSEIVVEGDVDIEATGNEAPGLEHVVVILGTCLLGLCHR